MRTHYLALITATVGPLFAQAVPQTGDWPAYGRDPGAVRFSPLDQINTTNVSQLQRAWAYHTGERGRAFEATPIMVDNVLYTSTQTEKIVALNPETGQGPRARGCDAARRADHQRSARAGLSRHRNREGRDDLARLHGIHPQQRS